MASEKGLKDGANVNVQVSVSFDLKSGEEDRHLKRYYFVMFAAETSKDDFTEYGRSTVISDPARPQFSMEYCFHTQQRLMFQLYLPEGETGMLDQGDPNTKVLGTVECTLGEVIGAGKGRLERRMVGFRKCIVTVAVREVGREKELAKFQCEGVNLHLPTTSKIFCVFERENDTSSTQFYRSEVVDSRPNAVWKPFSVPASTFTAIQRLERWWMRILLKRGAGNEASNTVLGEAKCVDYDTFRLNLGRRHLFRVQHPEDTGDTSHLGCVSLSMSLLQQPDTFLEVLMKGMQLRLTVAIDFTANTGDPADPSYRTLATPNKFDYVNALAEVGRVIQDYNSYKQFPVYGFGAKLPDGTISDDFQCNFRPSGDPNCSGVDGIIQAYYTSLEKVKRQGSGQINPILQRVSRLVTVKQSSECYFVLLILTTGNISDIEQATQTIAEMMQLPISIVMIGIGDSEDKFKVLEKLGGNSRKISREANRPARNIVKFARYRRADTGFVEEVLGGIPHQVLKYKEMSGRKSSLVPTGVPRRLSQPAPFSPPPASTQPASDRRMSTPQAVKTPASVPAPANEVMVKTESPRRPSIPPALDEITKPRRPSVPKAFGDGTRRPSASQEAERPSLPPALAQEIQNAKKQPRRPSTPSAPSEVADESQKARRLSKPAAIPEESEKSKKERRASIVAALQQFESDNAGSSGQTKPFTPAPDKKTQGKGPEDEKGIPKEPANETIQAEAATRLEVSTDDQDASFDWMEEFEKGEPEKKPQKKKYATKAELLFSPESLARLETQIIPLPKPKEEKKKGKSRGQSRGIRGLISDSLSSLYTSVKDKIIRPVQYGGLEATQKHGEYQEDYGDYGEEEAALEGEHGEGQQESSGQQNEYDEIPEGYTKTDPNRKGFFATHGWDSSIPTTSTVFRVDAPSPHSGGRRGQHSHSFGRKHGGYGGGGYGGRGGGGYGGRAGGPVKETIRSQHYGGLHATQKHGEHQEDYEGYGEEEAALEGEHGEGHQESSGQQNEYDEIPEGYTKTDPNRKGFFATHGWDSSIPTTSTVFRVDAPSPHSGGRQGQHSHSFGRKHGGHGGGGYGGRGGGGYGGTAGGPVKETIRSQHYGGLHATQKHGEHQEDYGGYGEEEVTGGEEHGEGQQESSGQQNEYDEIPEGYTKTDPNRKGFFATHGWDSSIPTTSTVFRVDAPSPHSGGRRGQHSHSFGRKHGGYGGGGYGGRGGGWQGPVKETIRSQHYGGLHATQKHGEHQADYGGYGEEEVTGGEEHGEGQQESSGQQNEYDEIPEGYTKTDPNRKGFFATHGWDSSIPTTSTVFRVDDPKPHAGGRQGQQSHSFGRTHGGYGGRDGGGYNQQRQGRGRRW